MPWGWECRKKMVKQMPPKPTLRKGTVSQEQPTPSPADYETPTILGGQGFSSIKRAPAYTFGHRTPTHFEKPAAKPTAPLFNVQGLLRNGRYKLKHGVMSPQIEPIKDKTNIPGPASYSTPGQVTCKRHPAYTMRPTAQPPYEPWDTWSPPPNMYWPHISGKNSPAYSFGNTAPSGKDQNIPGPGEHDPNINFTKKKKPAYSFGAPFKCPRAPRTPAPNTYCEKKFMVSKRTTPIPTFGIRHSQFLGEPDVFEKPENFC